ncbi:PD-(D/E)XK motif protein [Flavobacterium sp. J27]|uniref:PD-(D/E)XK motif protein n=1 Tax=Flavobacterium sp. J27 TaxID=2060419 RepID=UPI001030A51E|nr:PD-(D/E)XK motif protein [Flavobacterium sp. J27]
MNLIDLYDSLSLPENDVKVFNAIAIPQYPNFRVAIDFEGNAILLLSVSKRIKDLSLKNFRLKYLQLEQNLDCKIYENDSFKFQTFTVITFRCSDRNLQKYFIRISESLVKTVGQNPTQQQIIDSLKKFVEVFKTLTDSPTNTVNGLWAELFLIENSTNPKELINYWHNLPEEKFDFNAGKERIEVKSSSNFERKHIFSAEQLNPPSDTQVLIASVFLKQHNSGNNIQYLIDRISEKIDYDFDTVEKLNIIVFRTLGSSLEYSIGVKFDYEIAQQSLRFYRHQDIGKIEKVHIPNNVSEVKYKSDLTNVNPISSISTYKNHILFKFL